MDYLTNLKADVVDAFLFDLYSTLTGVGKNQYWIQIGETLLL
jgi:hypothetical protein